MSLLYYIGSIIDHHNVMTWSIYHKVFKYIIRVTEKWAVIDYLNAYMIGGYEKKSPTCVDIMSQK